MQKLSPLDFFTFRHNKDARKHRDSLMFVIIDRKEVEDVWSGHTIRHWHGMRRQGIPISSFARYVDVSHKQRMGWSPAMERSFI